MLEKRFMKDNQSWKNNIEQSKRNEWGRTIEDKILSSAPYPISYDVDSTQPINFSEFSYTEFMGGVILNTQSIEINTRNILKCSEYNYKDSKYHIDLLKEKLDDKYELETIEGTIPKIDEVIFIPGHNMFDIINHDLKDRIGFENPNAILKAHPLTDVKELNKIRGTFGWNRTIRGKISGMELLKKCEKAWVTSATELCTAAVVLDKDIGNITTFKNESVGIYYPINRILFKEQKENRQKVLNCIIETKHSGLLFPWMDDIDERIQAFFEETIKLKEHYRPISSSFNIKK